MEKQAWIRTGAGPHLPPLTPQPPGPLLFPLLSHAIWVPIRVRVRSNRPKRIPTSSITPIHKRARHRQQNRASKLSVSQSEFITEPTEGHKDTSLKTHADVLRRAHERDELRIRSVTNWVL